MRYVVKGERPNDCWRWIGAKKATGYGRVRIDYAEYRASRLSYALYVGDPGAHDVMHDCDNPECCNPKHLRLGTHADNMKDASVKGRWIRKGTGISRNSGLANGMARLPKGAIDEIRRLCGEGQMQKDVAAQFGIARSYVSQIMAGHRRAKAAGALELGGSEARMRVVR